MTCSGGLCSTAYISVIMFPLRVLYHYITGRGAATLRENQVWSLVPTYQYVEAQTSRQGTGRVIKFNNNIVIVNTESEIIVL